MNTYGINAHYYMCDLTDAGSRTELLEHIRSGGFIFSFLINVAGLDYEGLCRRPSAR